MAIACVAVISKENYPLCVWAPHSNSEVDVSLHFLVHTCIDVIEEKVSQVSSKASDPREHYLGLLYPSEDYKIYGYATNSRMKFIIVTENLSSQTKDQEMKQEEPPPSYSTIPTNQPTDAPPSYHDIMGISLIKQEIGAAKEGTSNLANMIFKICCICMGTVTCIGIGLILRATIPIALLVVGAVHLDDCDLDDRIPIWMVVHGSVYVAYVLASIFKLICCPDRKICCPNRKREGTEGTDSENKPSPMNSCVRFIETLLDLIQFVWLIVGSVWVLGKYDDWDDAGRPDCDGSSNNSDKCCNEGMFLFAFIYIIVAWSILFLMICCMCSCLCCCVVFAYTRRQKFMENLEAAREASATGEASGQA